MCDNCIYVCYDSCCNGYCGNKESSNFHRLTIDDRGCCITECKDKKTEVNNVGADA